MGRRPEREPGGGGAWTRHHTQRGHRQDSSARPRGARQDGGRPASPLGGEGSRCSSTGARADRRRCGARAGGHAVHGNVALAYAPQAMVVARVAPEDVVIPLSERVTLMELRESMCRWPMGDPTTPEFRFCGAKSPIGAGPYCAHHSRVAYQPAQDRRRAQIRAPRFA
ncbi:GcrA family cell cycle regulator [Methylocystis sp. IM4]|uniref:GcrA family cell cycle regulator n=1 Tax=Methylocystis sp. IM4 TaxID=3136560 RepID=UPI00311A1928